MTLNYQDVVDKFVQENDIHASRLKLHRYVRFTHVRITFSISCSVVQNKIHSEYFVSLDRYNLQMTEAFSYYLPYDMSL